MVTWTLPQEWISWISLFCVELHSRGSWRLPIVVLGLVMARGRRTVASWWRAAGVGSKFREYYYFVGSLGRKTQPIATALVRVVLAHLAPGDHLVFALDDSPTKRYGPCVQGAGRHHNPTPGPTNQRFLYGHVWVVISWIARHQLWGTIGLPLLAKLYVRQKDLPKIPARYGWVFQTKLVLAADLVRWIAGLLRPLGKVLWVVVDGAYAKAPFLKAAQCAGVVVISRLRKDAALRDLPPVVAPGKRGRGRPRIYGKNRIELAKRAGQKRGWQTVTAMQYGKKVTKTIKTFLATWHPVGGVIRVVLILEEGGWLAFFSTDPNLMPEAILEGMADRGTIEQNFHDMKEVEGQGQQQVRTVWANIGAFHLNLWVHTLTELWAWNRSVDEIRDRSNSPWDDPERRPSHADRRKALQRLIIGNEYSAVKGNRQIPQQIHRLINDLVKLAA
jgi:DDE superfamily endonuclease